MAKEAPHNRETPGSIPQPDKEAIASGVEDFLDKEQEILGTYGLRGDIVLERGNSGWAFDYAHRKLIYDPHYFVERGYSLKETLFATTHELMAHYGELLHNPERMLKEWGEKGRLQRRPHLRLLHNIFEDVLGNRRIVAELPFLEDTKTTLYKEKQFPKTDYRLDDQGQPLASHVQFVYGFIREMMVPGESVQVNEVVREALDKLRHLGPDDLDVLDLVTTPTIDTADRLRIMRGVVEPIYQELYKKDVEDEKKKGGGKGSGNKGDGQPQQRDKSQKGDDKDKGKKKWWPRGKGDQKSGEKEEGKGEGKPEKPGTSSGGPTQEEIEKKFKEQYRAYESTHPEPLRPEDEDKIKDALKEIVTQRGGLPLLDKAILEQWAREHGVSAEDVLGYRKEFQEIRPLIGELREVFKQIISKRLRERWRVRPQLETEGEELSEETLVESYIESRAGGTPRAFREIERQAKEQVGYGALDMDIVSDLSGSMAQGSKLEMERKSELLFLEALADFQKEIEEAEYESGVSLGLTVRTEGRAFGDFGDTELKKLSSELTEVQRISIWKKLRSVKENAGTPDYLSLEAILGSITPEYERELKEKKRRRVVVVLSDGGSQDAERVQRALTALREKGVIVFALGMTASGAPVKETYRPDAEVIEDITTLPRAVQKLILKYVQDL